MTATDPADGAVEVLAGRPVTATFSEAIDDSTRLRNVVFRYGSPSYSAIEINSANPAIDDCTFAYNSTAIDYTGTAGDPAEGWIHDSDFYGNTAYASFAALELAKTLERGVIVLILPDFGERYLSTELFTV